MNKHEDTIFALATPSGKSAIAVIRLSGVDSFNIVNKMSTNMPTIPNTATLNKIELWIGLIFITEVSLQLQLKE